MSNYDPAIHLDDDHHHHHLDASFDDDDVVDDGENGTDAGNPVDEDDDDDGRDRGNASQQDNSLSDENESPTKPPPSSPRSSKQHNKKKRDMSSMRKAPQAPKRFKSSYICFFTSKQSEIKEELGDKASVSAVSKRSAQMWKDLSKEERAYWDDVAAKDKERYMVEKASYTGPWQIPYKRAKKDPSAPKRPMSAFLLFSQGKRQQIKEENPGVKNTEISRLLGELWRACTDEERKPFVEEEKSLREKYKEETAKWKIDFEKRQEEEQKRQQEQLEWQRLHQQHAQQQFAQQQQHQTHAQQQNRFNNPGQQYRQIPYMNPPLPPPPGYAPYQQQGYPQQYANYPPQGSYQYQGGRQHKQPVILGPNGMPIYQMLPPPPPPPAPAPAPHMYHGNPHPPPGSTYDDNHGPLSVPEATYDDLDPLAREPQGAE